MVVSINWKNIYAQEGKGMKAVMTTVAHMSIQALIGV